MRARSIRRGLDFGKMFTVSYKMDPVILSSEIFLGFDLSTMGEGLYDEAIIDVVGPETMLSQPYTVKVS